MLNNFTYLPQGLHQLKNEEITIPHTNESVYLLHDNVSNVSLYTGLNSSGSIINGYTVNQDSVRDYEYYLLFDEATRSTYGGQKVYCNYTSNGDQADDKLLTELRLELIRLGQLVDSQSLIVPLSITSTTPLSDTSNYNGTTVSFKTNKWLKKNQTTKLKIYTDANRTVELAGNVTMTNDDEYTFTPSSAFVSSSMYYVRIFSGLQSVDGSELKSNYDFAFLTS